MLFALPVFMRNLVSFLQPNFGGVIYVESLPLAGTALQKYFVTPSYSYMLRTRHLL